MNLIWNVLFSYRWISKFSFQLRYPSFILVNHGVEFITAFFRVIAISETKSKNYTHIYKQYTLTGVRLEHKLEFASFDQAWIPNSMSFLPAHYIFFSNINFVRWNFASIVIEICSTFCLVLVLLGVHDSVFSLHYIHLVVHVARFGG